MDPKARKAALRSISYGLYVLTVKSGEQISGATVTWLSQASFEPPMIMVGLNRKSGTYRAVKESGRFAVNIVGKSQKEIAEAFFRETEVDDRKINGFGFKTATTGAPILSAVPAWFECEVDRWLEGSDHDICIAKVINAGRQSDEEPLPLKETGWNYGG